MDEKKLKEELEKRKEEREQKVKEEFESVKKLLREKNNGKYNRPYLQRQLHENISLRKVFLAIIDQEPARISEISEGALLTKPTCYAQLHKLMELHLVKRTYVMPVMEGKVKNKKIKEKFEVWTKSMPEQLKRYYLAKTSFWEITDFGMEFAKQAYHFEQEFREEDKKDG